MADDGTRRPKHERLPESWGLWALEAEDADAFLSRVLDDFRIRHDAQFVALLQPEKGRWLTLATSGAVRPLPLEVLAEALDAEASQQRGEWLILAGSDTRSDSPAGVWLAAESSHAAVDVAELEGETRALVRLWQACRQRTAERRRLQRLETILQITTQWSQAQDTVALLEEMAEAATRLLAAERASIFLWDRTQKLLVGRPALGVDGNELVVPDDAGVVGHVVRTGESQRVDSDLASDQSLIARDVDQQLNFTTRNLICVPLSSSDGEIVGAFEVLNRQQGNFSAEDLEALQELAAHATVALETTQQRELLLNRQRHWVETSSATDQWIGQCAAIEALRRSVQRIASTDLSVLILGENGTGKDVLAKLIHSLSERRDQPFIAVNCAAIAENLLESELFGHEKGAFTGAQEAREGKFEIADGGTLFLDEIGDLSLDGQAALLRVLEDKTVVRVGGSRPITVNTRVFAATNQDLVQRVREKRFREDLYYRLNVVTLDLPPLRDRGDDVILLAEYFLRTFARQARRTPPKLTAAAKKRLLNHPWPGNVRELKNLMERLAYLSDAERIDAPDLSFIVPTRGRGDNLVSLNHTLADATRDFQIDFIKRQIEASRGKMTQAAKRLGLHRSNLYRKMRQLGMTVTDEDEDEVDESRRSM